MNPGRRAGLVCLLCGCLLLCACSEPLPAEQQVRAVMAKMQQAAEGKQLAELMQHFDDGFQGRHRMSKRELQARIHFHFRLNPQVRVYVSQNDIQVQGDIARVSCHLLLTGAQQQIPERGRLYKVTSTWRKQGAKWRVIQADWQDVIEGLGR